MIAPQSQAPFTEIQAIDLATSFKAAGTTPYVAVFITYGKGKHTFGTAEFKTIKEMAAEVTRDTSRYSLPQEDFVLHRGQNAAVITFANKTIYNSFMQAMLGHNVERHDLIVQVAGKSAEWHQVAGQHIAYVNRSRREEQIAGLPLGKQNVPLFKGTLVDYTFPDLATMKAFCERVNDGHFDRMVAEMKGASGSAAPHVS